MTATAAGTAETRVHRYSESLPCEPESAARARLLVSAALNTWSMEELAEPGALIVSEFVNNTIVHTRCRLMRVAVERRPRAQVIRIGVADRGGRLPEPRRPGDREGSGRGLLLVDALSRRWGCDRYAWGKVVWAELTMPDPHRPFPSVPLPSPQESTL
ncbi:ATP-binding protein [Streptomyces sp. NPDC002476]|uniref:ATP-binding protein n=1 Tax=Streptomyces sp. NPDC002476 TaxID=3364648 RepID=UPI0036A81592